jgi:hypothetical protein
MTVPIAAQRVATAVLVVAAEMCPDCAKTGAAERPGKGDAR